MILQEISPKNELKNSKIRVNLQANIGKLLILMNFEGEESILLPKICILKESFNLFMKSKKHFELQILKLLIRA